jgi:hypothetical protein
LREQKNKNKTRKQNKVEWLRRNLLDRGSIKAGKKQKLKIKNEESRLLEWNAM